MAALSFTFVQYFFVNISSAQVIPGNLQNYVYVSTNRSLLQCKSLLAHFSNNMIGLLFIKRYLKARWMAAVPSEEFRTVFWMFVTLLTANFKFRNRSTCSKVPMKRAGKVCGDSQDLKSPGQQPRKKDDTDTSLSFPSRTSLLYSKRVILLNN